MSANFTPNQNDYKNLTPFKSWLLLQINTWGQTNFPFVESDFDELTNYGMMMKLMNALNDVISNQNEVEQDITNLFNAFTELQSYVNNYLTDENLQPLINNKLDEMVQDGTMQNLIESYAQPILNDLTSEVETATTNVNNLVANVDTILQTLRKKYYDRYHLFELPSNMTNAWFKNISIYESQDKVNYTYNIDVDSLKNSGGSTYYVDNSFTGETTDGSESKPWKTLTTAFRNTSDGDTIIVKKGIYYRNDIPTVSSESKNNVNIICEDGTIFTTADSLSWSQNGTYSNVYQATRSGATSVVDIRNWKKGKFSRLTKVNSLATCSTTYGSYYTDNTNVYVNIGEVVTNKKVVVSLSLGYMALNFEPSGKNMNIYLENAICLNGSLPICRAVGNSSYTCNLIAKNCKFLFLENSDARDGLSLMGANSILINCESSFNGKDGFNYHANDGRLCYGIEVDCVANSNGIGRANPHTYNGSTAHDGCQIIRINGIYNNNNGSNVADVQTDTTSVNINCSAFDSMSNTDDLYDTDFCTQQAGATMYLYNCFAKGTSFKNLYCITGSTMNISNCNYDTITGGGTINIIN